MGCAASKPLDAIGKPGVDSQGAVLDAAIAPIKEVVIPTQPYAPADLPSNEVERLKELRSLNLLDTPRDPRFDEITQLLCKLFKMPMAIVSIIDEYRCWLKAREGLPISEAPRDISICAWTLVPPHPELLVINDTLEDARFRNCPIVVNPPHIRFYAGAPLVTSNGHRIGNLVVMDDKPGILDAERCTLLANFAEIVVRQVEKTTLAMTQRHLVNKSTQSLLRALDCFSEGLMLCNVGDKTWEVVYVNDSWGKITGMEDSPVVGTSLWKMAELHKPSSTMPQIESAIRARAEFAALLTINGRRLVGTFRPAHQGQLSPDMPVLGIPSGVPWNHLPSTNQPFYFGTLRPATPADETGTSLLPPPPASTANEFSDVVLGPVLGQGSFGKVYRASWRGTPVAVKIIQCESGNAARNNAARKQLEDIAGTKVVHPNIVPTYKVFTRAVDGHAPMVIESAWGSLGKQGASGTPSDKDSAAAPRGRLVGPGLTSLMTSTASESVAGSMADSAVDVPPRRHDGGSDYASVCSEPRTEEAEDMLTRRASHELASTASQSGKLEAPQATMQETWLLMELCDMGTLVDACQRGLFMTVNDDNTGMVLNMHVVCETLLEVACALDYLHNMDILHADLNGNNVLLLSCNRGARRFTAKVSDFGLSRVVNGVVQTATTGTPTHMPPELLADGDLSKGTDVYAFGVIMWEVYHGKRAWAGMHPMQVLFRVAVQKHPLDFPNDVHQDYVARPTTKELVRELRAMLAT